VIKSTRAVKRESAKECRGAEDVARKVQIVIVETLSSSLRATKCPKYDYARII